MSGSDDPPKKPPRASWEPSDPDEAAPAKPAAPEGSKSKPTSKWTPPPVEDPWLKKPTPRAETKPPRASWEPPDPDEAVPTPSGRSVSGSWETPSVVVEPESSVIATEPSGHRAQATAETGRRDVAGADRDSYALAHSDAYTHTTSGEYAVTHRAGEQGGPSETVQSDESPSGAGRGEQPSGAGRSEHAQPSGPGRGEYAQPQGRDTLQSGEYAQPGRDTLPSGEYAQPQGRDTLQSGEYAQSSGYSQPGDAHSGAYARPGESGAYPQPASDAYSASGAYSQPASGAVAAPMSTTSSSAVPRVAASKDSDDPMAPLSTLSEDNALRAAVGAKLKKEPKPKGPPPPDDFDDGDDDGGEFGDGPRKGRMKWVLALSLIGVLGLGIGALVIFGNINKQRFLIACEPQEVHAKQGRGFPPWGERSIDDEGMWKPIKIPPEAECRERETEDQEELSGWYLEILSERASSLLTAREVTKIDEAAALLEQALLHARSPERRDQRHAIERLLGDVGYWRASAKLKDAAAALTEASKQFDAAAAQRPRHVSDASAWAAYVRKLVEELRAGPNGALTAFPPTPPAPGREPAPPGVALPVEPPPDAGSGSAEPPAAPPDAGLPTGGVLL